MARSKTTVEVKGSVKTVVRELTGEQREKAVVNWVVRLSTLTEQTLSVMHQKGMLVAQMVQELKEEGLVEVAERLHVSVESLNDPRVFAQTFCPPRKRGRQSGYAWDPKLDYEVHLLIARSYQWAINQFGPEVQEKGRNPNEWLEVVVKNHWGHARLKAELGMYYAHDLQKLLARRPDEVKSLLRQEPDGIHPAIRPEITREANRELTRLRARPKPDEPILTPPATVPTWQPNQQSDLPPTLDEIKEKTERLRQKIEARTTWKIVVEWLVDAASSEEAEEELRSRIDLDELPGATVKVSTI